MGFITRYQSGNVWTTGTAEQTSLGVHTNTAAIGTGIPSTGSVVGAYLTKTSDPTKPLPVQLLSFDAVKKEHSVSLVWKTTNENNNKGFDVERSADGKTWSTIGFVSSKSNKQSSDLAYMYNLEDFSPLVGKNYYRLKQVDFNDQYEYSSVKIVMFDSKPIINIFPNPFVDQITITGLNGNEKVSIHDASGKLVYVSINKSAILTVNLNELSAGAYFVHVMHQDGTTTTQQVVKRN